MLEGGIQDGGIRDEFVHEEVTDKELIQDSGELDRVSSAELLELRQKRELVYDTSDRIAKVWLLQQKCIDDLVYLRGLYDEHAKSFNSIQKVITDKYGEVSIDLQTGVLTYVS